MRGNFFYLVYNGEKQRVKSSLLAPLTLFRDHPELLESNKYEVQSEAAEEEFFMFVDSLRGEDVEVDSSNVQGLRRLCDEFGYAGLDEAFAKFSQKNPLFTVKSRSEEKLEQDLRNVLENFQDMYDQVEGLKLQVMYLQSTMEAYVKYDEFTEMQESVARQQREQSESLSLFKKQISDIAKSQSGAEAQAGLPQGEFQRLRDEVEKLKESLKGSTKNESPKEGRPEEKGRARSLEEGQKPKPKEETPSGEKPVETPEGDDKIDVWSFFQELKRSEFDKSPEPYAQGKSGPVFKGVAKNENLGVSDVAMQELQTAGESDYLARKLEALALCSDQAVLKPLGIIQPDESCEVPTLVTPRMTGSLEDWIENRPGSAFENVTLTPIEKYIIIYGISRGLAEAQAHNIVHGCLSPRCILLDENRYPVITGFGLVDSTKTKQEIDWDSTGADIRYAAPECLGGLGTMKSDVFSFGMLIWAIWNREHPFGKQQPRARDHLLGIAQGQRPKLFPNDGDDCHTFLNSWLDCCWNPISDARWAAGAFENTFENDLFILGDDPENQAKFDAYVQFRKEIKQKRVYTVKVPVHGRSIQQLMYLVRKNVSDASVELGLRYEKGDGCEQDLKKALQLYLGAASEGNGDAYYYIGRMNRDGLLGPKDEKEARAYFERALIMGSTLPLDNQ